MCLHDRLTLLPMDITLSPPAGQLLDGRYRVESRLAQGGMATVYLGRDTRLDRVVAIKIANRELAGDGDFIRRFMTEARAVAQLSSPNVVAVFDQGSEPAPGGDINYIVMEYVAGPTLREVLNARGRLGVTESLDVIEGVLSGLAAAHRAGIIHRDVKPENVLLGKDGAVKVADFGLARAAVAAASTQTGMIIGTAAYLAPEQVSRSSSDARTDVYAAGVMLFEMLTGEQPHTGGSPLEVAYKHVNEAVPAPSGRAPGLPPALDALVAMSTSRDPDLRPPDAGHFLQAVAELRRGGPAGYQPQGYQAQGYQAPGYAPGPPGATAAFPQSASMDETDLRPAIRGFGGPGQAAANHTLVVAPGAIIPGFGEPGYDEPGYREPEHRRGYRDHGYRRHGDEPLLQSLLFSRRLVYVLGTVAVLLAAGLLGWYLTAGQSTQVPRLAGFSAGLARHELANAGLRARDGAQRHSDVPAGHVIRTVPAALTKVGNGSTVTLILSLGPVRVSVPQVTGEPVQQAVAALRAAGLRVATPVQQPSDTIQPGLVISTSPAGGTLWPNDKPVTVLVSAGPPLPDFVGAQLPAAQAAAAQGGYQINPVAATTNTQPAGTIVSQSPTAGTPIQPGEVVTVQVSAGPPTVSVPDVEGQSLQLATQELQQAGFQVSVVGGIGRGDHVQLFSPTGQAPKGSVITLTVGFGF
jgi:beta-lactam-binding protein with PASTA domain